MAGGGQDEENPIPRYVAPRIDVTRRPMGWRSVLDAVGVPARAATSVALLAPVSGE